LAYLLCPYSSPPVCSTDVSPFAELQPVCAHSSCRPLTFDINGETPVAAVLLEYKQEGMDAEAAACHIKQRFPNLPIILLSTYSEMHERILWSVDECVMKSEPPEWLVPILERAQRLAPRST
jgi:CheY-like chemotaxis protein